MAAALEQWGLLIGELQEDKWIATGNGVPEGGRRDKIAPEQLLRDGLNYDVRDNAIYWTRDHGTWREETFRLVDTITVEAAPESDIEAAQPGPASTESPHEAEVPSEQRKRIDEPDFLELGPLVQAAALALDALEDRGEVLTAKRKPKLADLVTKEVGETVSPKTVQKAEAYRREHPRGNLK